MLLYQKAMFDRYFCIMSLFHLKTLEKCFENSFLYYFNHDNDAQNHEGFVGFENACSRAKTYVINQRSYYNLPYSAF